MFNGEVYRGFDALSLTKAELDYTQDTVRVLSGLYGTFHPYQISNPLNEGKYTLVSAGSAGLGCGSLAVWSCQLPFQALDVLISDFKLAIEYDGVHWHSGKENKDRKKNFALKKLGINLFILLMHLFGQRR